MDNSESNSFIKSVGRQNIKEKPKRKSSTISIAFTQTDLEILTLYYANIGNLHKILSSFLSPKPLHTTPKAQRTGMKYSKQLEY